MSGPRPRQVLLVDRRGGGGPPLPDLGLPADRVIPVHTLDATMAALSGPDVGVVVFLSAPGAPLEAAMVAEAARVIGLPFVRVDPPERRPDGTCHVPAGAAACAFDTPAVARVVAAALEARDPARPAVEAQEAARRLRDQLQAMTAQLAALEDGLEVARLHHPPRAALSLAALTAREREVVGHLRSGATNKEIAAALFLSPHTVGNHLRHIYRKLGVSGRAELLGRLGGG